MTQIYTASIKGAIIKAPSIVRKPFIRNMLEAMKKNNTYPARSIQVPNTYRFTEPAKKLLREEGVMIIHEY